MKILFLYTTRMLSKNKARTVVTFIGIVLSFTLLTAVLTGTSSLLHFMTEFMKVRDGDYYGVIYSCDEMDEKRLVESSEVTESTRMGIVGITDYSTVTKIHLEKKYVAIGSVDSTYFDEMGVKVLEGRLPENNSEIIVPQMMITNQKEISVGDTITWQIGQRIGSDGRVIEYQKSRCEDQASEDHYEKETIQVQQTKTYTVVGISTNPGYVSTQSPYFLVLTTGEQTTCSDIYFKMKNIDDVSPFITENFSDHDWAVNKTLLSYLGRSTAYVRYALYGMCAVLAVVIAIASAGLIYNSFSIAIAERTRQFGLFKSVGATRSQLRISVFFEAAILSLMAVPVGLLIGCVGVKCVLYLLKDSFAAAIRSSGEVYAQSVTITFYTQIWYLVVAVIVGLITIFVSAMIPAIRAGKVTPIEAIRQTNDIKIAKIKIANIKNPRKEKHLHGNGLWGKLFGVGGMIAYRNAKRNRKSYRTISFSLATCLFLFLGGGGFYYYIQLSMKGLGVPYHYDYHIVFGSQYDETIDPSYRTQEFHREITNQLNELSDVSEAIYIRKANLPITADESDLTDVGKLALGEYLVDGKLQYRTDIYFVEETQYEAYLKKLGLEPSEYLRSDNPKLLILNSAKGAVYLENGQRKFYEGTIFQDASKLTGISIVGRKRIGDAWYAYQDPEDPNTMIYIEGDGKNTQTEDDLTKIKVPLEESIEALSFEVGETIRAENYPYWAWGSDWAFVLPLSALPEDTMLGVSTNDYVYMTANDSARALEQIIQLQNEYNGAFQTGTPSQSSRYDYSMLRIFQIFLLCFLVLIILISLANIANTITTSVRLRTREYAMIRSVGCSKRTFLCMIAAENLGYTLRGFVIGSFMGGVANYAFYQYMQDAIYTNRVIPIFLYGIGAAVFALVFVFATIYTWKKVQRGQICEELRKEAF